MDLHLSFFLLLVLFTGGHSLSCYECTSLTGSCAGQQVTTCPELSQTCISSTVAGLIDGNPIKAKFKGCVPSNTCLYPNISTADAALFCCNKDLCNVKDAELSGDSSPNISNIPNFSNFSNIPNIPNFSNIPNIPNFSNIPNGKKCYYCDGKSCSNIMDCSGSQDRCIAGTVTANGQTLPVNGCGKKEVCDSVQSISCCEGNLCNGSQRVTQSVLILCGSLLSYFLMH